MPREFCTLFDSGYLVKALALYRSLEATGADFRLTAFCFDERARSLLERMELPRLTVVALRELEGFDQGLAAVKGDRSAGEYCWTATPALPRYLFATRPDLDEVTYLDADLFFFADPEPLFAEMGDASVLITPHGYSPEYRHLEVSGTYCVQFMTFRRDARGERALDWWHARCLEWCYARLEDGKFGDQKYLDDWPERFEGVHVLRHPGGGLAPWNATAHTVRHGSAGTEVDGRPLVFFHFHDLDLVADGFDWRPAGYAIPRAVRRLAYEPYLVALEAAWDELRAVEPGFDAGVRPAPSAAERLRNARAAAINAAVRRLPALARLRPGAQA